MEANMKNELRFALYAIKKNIQGSMELRASFWTSVIGMMVNNSAFVILWVFFALSVGEVGGWQAIDVVGLLGFSTLSYGIVMSVTAGIAQIASYIMTGSFDRFLVSPKNIFLRISTSAFNASAVGDILFGVICLVVFLFAIHATGLQILLTILFTITTAIIFFAGVITAMGISFFFADAYSTANSLIEFFITPSLFHGGAFQGGLRFIFTFIIPALAVAALPVEAVRGASLSDALFLVVLTLGWLAFSIWVFNRGVRRYESSNFMTFGS